MNKKSRKQRKNKAESVFEIMIKIMFVCHGNICRSPMAEFIMKKIVAENGKADQFLIVSSATSTEEIGNGIHRGTKMILDKYGIKYTQRSAVQLCAKDYHIYDLFIGMDRANIRNMNRIFGSDPDKKITKLLDYIGICDDVADPWYTGDFEETYRDISEGCKALYKKLTT